MKTISCRAAYGNGGLGRHLEELVEDARTQGSLSHYYTTAPRAQDHAGVAVSDPLAPRLARWTPVRFSPGWSAFLGFDLFDRAVARTIAPAETHVGFSFQSLHTFRSARAHGCERLELISPTCHVDLVRRRYEEAYRAHPIERSWLNEPQCRKAVREYELADTIVIASDYVRDSFLEAGFPEERLSRFDLRASPRFSAAPLGRPPDDGIFRIVYVGALSVAKGIPVLLDAFAGFGHRAAELTLVGGYGTRGMRRYLRERCARDQRISIEAGDPLPHLHRADVYVHPSYQDGSPYAPLEALACALPLILTEDTGTKELVRDGVNGRVVRTGSPEAILETLREALDRWLTGAVA